MANPASVVRRARCLRIRGLRGVLHLHVLTFGSPDRVRGLWFLFLFRRGRLRLLHVRGLFLFFLVFTVGLAVLFAIFAATSSSAAVVQLAPFAVLALENFLVQREPEDGLRLYCVRLPHLRR